MGSEPVTLRDVATIAHVSISTVSKVLNGGGRVSVETRQRIIDAAERLAFRPNALAKSFATGRSLTVGVLSQYARGTFSMPVLTGASSALGAADIASLLYDVDHEPANLAEKIRRLQARRVDGLLVVGNGLGSPLRSVSAGFQVPVTYVFGLSESSKDTSFLPDSRMAGELACQHLIDIGRTRIAHITAANDLAATERAEGLAETMRRHSLPLVLGSPLRGDWTRNWGAAAANSILPKIRKIDAIFCGNDSIALGVQSVLRNAGVRVPDDVALVGVDNLGGLLGRPDALLTTIDVRHSDLGAGAAEYLLNSMDGGIIEPTVHYQECTLMLGASTMGAALTQRTGQEFMTEA